MLLGRRDARLWCGRNGSTIGQVGARLVHESETSEIFGLHRLDKGRPQGPHPFGVAVAGVDTPFFRRKSNACTARPSVAP